MWGPVSSLTIRRSFPNMRLQLCIWQIHLWIPLYRCALGTRARHKIPPAIVTFRCIVVWRGISNSILTARRAIKLMTSQVAAALTYTHTYMHMYVYVEKLTSKISCASVNKPKTTAIDPSGCRTWRRFCIRSIFPLPQIGHTHTRTLIIICRLDPDPDSSRYIFRYPSVNNSFSSHSCWRSSHESPAKLTPHRGEEGKFWDEARGTAFLQLPRGTRDFFFGFFLHPRDLRCSVALDLHLNLKVFLRPIWPFDIVFIAFFNRVYPTRSEVLQLVDEVSNDIEKTLW